MYGTRDSSSFRVMAYIVRSEVLKFTRKRGGRIGWRCTRKNQGQMLGIRWEWWSALVYKTSRSGWMSVSLRFRSQIRQDLFGECNDDDVQLVMLGCLLGLLWLEWYSQNLNSVSRSVIAQHHSTYPPTAKKPCSNVRLPSRSWYLLPRPGEWVYAARIWSLLSMIFIQATNWNLYLGNGYSSASSFK
jgi:hypothetical protein